MALSLLFLRGSCQGGGSDEDEESSDGDVGSSDGDAESSVTLE